MPSPLNITNIPAPRTPIVDANTGYLTREWYRFFLSLFVLTGSGSNPTSLDDLQIGPPNNDQFVLDLQNITEVQINNNPLVSDIAEIEKQVQGLEITQTNDNPLVSEIAKLQKQVQTAELSAEAAVSALQAQIMSLSNDVQGLAIAPPTTPNLRKRCYGSFYDTTDQTAAAINTAYAMTFNTTDLSNGVYIGSPTSRIYVERAGIYDIQFSAQLDKASGSAANVWIWLDKNGTSVTESATQITLQGSNSATVAAWNFLLQMNDGDYFRLMWATDDTGCFIKHDPNAPPVPGIPSIILTVTDNISAYQD